MGEHPRPEKERMYKFEMQTICLDDFECAGYILDIGGGGEGIIGQLKGTQVIAIDPNKRELAEAAPGPLKIAMDARDLQFLDESFAAATSFFTLMFIQELPDREKVMAEVFRVLKPGASFFIWDAIVPAQIDLDKDVFVIMLTVKLPDQQQPVADRATINRP